MIHLGHLNSFYCSALNKQGDTPLRLRVGKGVDGMHYLHVFQTVYLFICLFLFQTIYLLLDLNIYIDEASD